MRKFLAYELDRDLRGRAFEQKKELPLGRVENQPCILYAKGSLVMCALADYIGEDVLDKALRELRDEYAFKGPPYPNGPAVIERICRVTPHDMQYLIDVGVLDAAGEPIVLERKRISQQASTFTLMADRKPATAGIDPLNKLIDRRPNDNTLSVTVAAP